MESSLNEVINDGGSLLNQASAGPFSVIAKLCTVQGPGSHVAPFDSYKC